MSEHCYHHNFLANLSLVCSPHAYTHEPKVSSATRYTPIRPSSKLCGDKSLLVIDLTSAIPAVDLTGLRIILL